MSCPPGTPATPTPDPLDVIVDLVSRAGFTEAAETLRFEFAVDARPAEDAILDILHQIDAILYAHPTTGALELRVLDAPEDRS